MFNTLMARANTFIMLGWWPLVWYGVMLPNKDYAPMSAMTYFKALILSLACTVALTLDISGNLTLDLHGSP